MVVSSWPLVDQVSISLMSEVNCLPLFVLVALCVSPYATSLVPLHLKQISTVQTTIFYSSATPI